MKAVVGFRQARQYPPADLPEPGIEDVSDEHVILVRVPCVGADGTGDRTNATEFEAIPEVYGFILIGHARNLQGDAETPDVEDAVRSRCSSRCVVSR
jgi:hypothetical protein